MDTRIPLVLKEISGYGNQRVRQLLDVYSRKPVALDELFPWIKETIGSKNLKLRIPESDEVHQAIERAMKRLDQSAEHGVELVTWLDPLYPDRLRHIPNAPVYYFYKGNYDCIRRDLGVAIIGTREVSEYGKKIARRLGYLFGDEGFTVFSGLAIGCDQLAHEGCLEAKGSTVAIMPCGLDMVVPESNASLAERIISQEGCLLSEYPIGMKPAKNTYVERDRLQSGFSRGILVVETDVEGGTMHTVGFAEKQGRQVACYDHQEKYLEEHKTKGNQMLIREGRALPVKDKESLTGYMEKLRSNDKNMNKQTSKQPISEEHHPVQLELGGAGVKKTGRGNI